MKHKSKKKTAKSGGKLGHVVNVSQASKLTGLSAFVIKWLRNPGGSKAFLPSGRIDCDILLADAKLHAAEISEAQAEADSAPDIKIEKALKARADRQTAEINVQHALETIAPLDICRRILIRGAALARQKFMAIPDRTAEKFSLMTDAAKIREILIEEISNALRVLSEEAVDKLIKDVLHE